MTSDRLWRVRRTTVTTLRARTAMDAVEAAGRDEGAAWGTVQVEAVEIGGRPPADEELDPEAVAAVAAERDDDYSPEALERDQADDLGDDVRSDLDAAGVAGEWCTGGAEEWSLGPAPR